MISKIGNIGIFIENIFLNNITDNTLTIKTTSESFSEASHFGTLSLCIFNLFESHCVGSISVFMGQMYPQYILPKNTANIVLTTNKPSQTIMFPVKIRKVNSNKKSILILKTINLIPNPPLNKTIDINTL